MVFLTPPAGGDHINYSPYRQKLVIRGSLYPLARSLKDYFTMFLERVVSHGGILYVPFMSVSGHRYPLVKDDSNFY